MRILDNIIALRILWILITPFEKTDAFKLGLIDVNGNRLRKAKTSEETNATSMLHRLVWNIKRLINLVPGGSTRLGSMVAAYALVRESVDNNRYDLDEAEINERLLTLVESYSNEDILELMSIIEDVMANITGVNVSTDKPVVKKKRAFAKFDVSDDTYGKFANGKTKFRRWSNYLNLQDDTDQKIYDYARKNPHGILVLSDSKGNSKGIRYSKHGGGKWHKISRRPKDIVDESLNIENEIEVIELK